MQSFLADAGADGKSLVRVVLSHYPGLTAGRLYQALRRRDIRVNGRRQHQDCTIAAGDTITLFLNDEILAGSAAVPAGSFPATPDPSEFYTIIYQDPLLVLVCKKPGISVQAAAGSGGKPQEPTLLDRARQDLREPGLELCHRLDRQTGGLLLLSRRPAALAAVRELMQSGRIIKRYRCLTLGRPDQGQPVVCLDGCLRYELTAWLEKVAARSEVYIHDQKQSGDLPIVTRYRVIRVYPGAGPEGEEVAELEVELVSGRTHQIRAHLAHIGHPLLGDGKYGRNKLNRRIRGRSGPLRRQQLYATQLHFAAASQGLLAYLAGRVFTVEPDFDWPEPGQSPSSVEFD
ncbi:MAG TPA: hypothetical protein DD640_05775 [Clostridiales bacterium]|nr:hypothetical protein [Clostridiales bacterium]